MVEAKNIYLLYLQIQSYGSNSKEALQGTKFVNFDFNNFNSGLIFVDLVLIEGAFHFVHFDYLSSSNYCKLLSCLLQRTLEAKIRRTLWF